MKSLLFVLMVLVLVTTFAFASCAQPAATPAPKPAPAPSAEPVKPTELHFASWSNTADPVSEAAEQMAKDLEKVTGGKIKMKISYGGALGKPPEYYDLAVKGAADITFACPTYLPGRFPLMDLINYPVLFPDNIVATKAFWELWKKGIYDKELSEVKVLWLWTPGPEMFFFSKDRVAKLSDFQGKKIRAPGGPEVPIIEAVGSVPVRMQLSDVYEGMKLGTLDGAMSAWSAGVTFKLYEVSKYATDIKTAVFPFTAVMNKQSWEKLPKEAQTLLEDTKEKYSLQMAERHQQNQDACKKLLKDKGGEILELSAADTTEMQNRFKSVWDKWVGDLEAKGVPAKKARDELYTILQNLGVKEPFAR